jgi:hypothetical protein
MGYAVMIGFGADAIAKGAAGADPDALGTLAKHYDGWFLRGWIDLVVITDALSLSVALTVSATRGVFALARDGLLPRFLATTSSHDTPLGGNLVSFVFSVGFLAWASVVHYGAGFGLPDTLAALPDPLAGGVVHDRADLRLPRDRGVRADLPQRASVEVVVAAAGGRDRASDTACGVQGLALAVAAGPRQPWHLFRHRRRADRACVGDRAAGVEA